MNTTISSMPKPTSVCGVARRASAALALSRRFRRTSHHGNSRAQWVPIIKGLARTIGMRKFFNEMNYIFSKYGIFEIEGLSFTPKVDEQLKHIPAKERQLNKVLHFEALSCGWPTLHALFSVELVTTDELQR
jgi:pyruvate dehydrogenase complex dehydrogenase (E1) component